MKAPSVLQQQAATYRILKTFHAVAEYDEFGRLLGSQGTLTTQSAWSTVAAVAASRAGVEAEKSATAIVLADMILATVDLQGGGTLIAILERPLADAAAEELTDALNRALGDYVGPIPVSLAVVAGVLMIALILFNRDGLD